MAKKKPALKTDTPQPISTDLYTRIATLISQARQSIVKNIDYTMVYTHFEIGRMIVEDEQQGNAKATYGAKTLKELQENYRQILARAFQRGILSKCDIFISFIPNAKFRRHCLRNLPALRKAGHCLTNSI
jgi:hypothetical protein